MVSSFPDMLYFEVYDLSKLLLRCCWYSWSNLANLYMDLKYFKGVIGLMIPIVYLLHFVDVHDIILLHSLNGITEISI